MYTHCVHVRIWLSMVVDQCKRSSEWRRLCYMSYHYGGDSGQTTEVNLCHGNRYSVLRSILVFYLTQSKVNCRPGKLLYVHKSYISASYSWWHLLLTQNEGNLQIDHRVNTEWFQSIDMLLFFWPWQWSSCGWKSSISAWLKAKHLRGSAFFFLLL